MHFRLNVAAYALAIIAIATITSASAQKIPAAKITKAIDEVQLIQNNTTRIAIGGEAIGEGAELRTGTRGRVELTSRNNAIARLGVTTKIRLKDGGRDLALSEGAVLVYVPPNAGDVKIESPLVNAVLKDTTAVFEFHPAIYKLLVLNGTTRLFRPNHVGDSILVNAGQMAFGNPKMALADAVDFDIGHFVKTCRLITDFSRMQGEVTMASAREKQKQEKTKKDLIDTNLVIFGGGSVVSIINPAQTGLLDQATGVSSQPVSKPATQPSDLGEVKSLSRSKSAPSPTP